MPCRDAVAQPGDLLAASSVVHGHDLDVERAVEAVQLVLDARVGEHHVALVVARQVVLVGPLANLVERPVGPPVRILAVAVPLLQKLLVLGLEVVLQLTRTLDAVVERLSVALRPVALPPAGLEQIPALARQGDHSVVSVEADGLDEPGIPQMPPLAVARVERLVERVAQVAGWDDAEGADAAQRAAFRPMLPCPIAGH